MKLMLFFVAFSLLLACENSKNKKEASEDKEYNDNDKRVEAPKEPPVYIAFREDKDGVVYLTDSDDDINTLIVDLKPLNVEMEFLEPDFWRDERCRKMSARKCNQGNCVVGNCNLVRVGNWNVCRCQ